MLDDPVVNRDLTEARQLLAKHLDVDFGLERPQMMASPRHYELQAWEASTVAQVVMLTGDEDLDRTTMRAAVDQLGAHMPSIRGVVALVGPRPVIDATPHAGMQRLAARMDFTLHVSSLILAADPNPPTTCPYDGKPLRSCSICPL